METKTKHKRLKCNQCYRMVRMYRDNPAKVLALAGPVLAAISTIAMEDGFVYGDTFHEAIAYKYSLAQLASAYAVASVDKLHRRWVTCLESALAK